MSSSISGPSSVSPYVSSLLFSKTPLTAQQQQYLKENYAITATADNTTVTPQADGTQLVRWHGSFQLASDSSDSTIVYNPTGSGPTNVSTDKTPTLADVAKAISGSAGRNEDFNLLDTFFNPAAASTASGVNNPEPQRLDRKA